MTKISYDEKWLRDQAYIRILEITIQELEPRIKFKNLQKIAEDLYNKAPYATYFPPSSLQEIEDSCNKLMGSKD